MFILILIGVASLVLVAAQTFPAKSHYGKLQAGLGDRTR
jgi:hypothetical protein